MLFLMEMILPSVLKPCVVISKPDVKVQQDQQEKMAVMGFLAALHSEYDSVRAQILSSLEVSSFQETFIRILHIEISSPALPFA